MKIGCESDYIYLNNNIIMNKFYTLLLLSGAAITANAQQINGTFDADWTDCIPWDSKGNSDVSGANPDGWHISNVKTVLGEKIVGTSIDNGDGKAVLLKNEELVGNRIPAYLTLGTPWATAEVKGITVKNSDGGTFGGLSFEYHPDALKFDYKRDNKNGAEDATVVAYLWKGTWTQKDVPGNTALWTSATKKDMTNRDRNVLGMSTVTGGDTIQTNGAALIASLEQSITNSTGEEWQTLTIPFTYEEGRNGNTAVENINVIFSATDYFGDRNNIVAGNSLTIDNVKLVYYHALTALITTDAEGNAVDLNEEFKEDKYDYTVNAAYDEFNTEVEYTVKGVAAKAEEDYDEDTQVLTITVKGEDYNEDTNPEAKTVYTIKYKKAAPTLSSLVVAGHEFIAAGNEAKDFTATGKYYADEVSYTASSEAATVESNYDESTGKLTFALNEDGAVSNTVYTITFEGNQKDAVYQIPNSDFENWNDEGKLTESWNSFDTAAGLFASFASMSPMPEKIDGVEGNGVRITSKNLIIACANGNMTTGTINMGNPTPSDASNYNFTDRTNVNSNLPFAGKPDAFEVYARFTPGTQSPFLATEEAVDLQGRVQLILHGEAAYHDPELTEQTDEKIASASVLIPATENWTKFTGEFHYTGNESTGVKYLLASATTNPVPGASQDDKLDLDELHLIYYSTLADLQFNGKTVENFAPETLNYTVTGNYDDADKLAYVLKGNGAKATVERFPDEKSVVITVYGNDFEVNSDNKTVYTIVFKTTDGISSITAEDAKNHKVYTLDGVRVNGKPAAGLYIVDGKKMMVK